jgi:soluble lytic murein transglycosylase
VAAGLALLLGLCAFAAVSCGGKAARPSPGQAIGEVDGPATSGGVAPTAAPGSSPSPAPAQPLEARDALAVAGALLREGRYEEAAAGFETVAGQASDPEVKGAAALGAGVAKFAAGDHDGSIIMLQQAAALAPVGTSAHRRSAYLLGSRLNDANRFGDAVSVLEGEAESTASDALQPYLVLAYAKALSGAGDVRATGVWSRLSSLPGLTPSLQGDIYRERARLARAAADDPELLHWLVLLAGASGLPADRLELAVVARRAGDITTFGCQLGLIVSGSPGSAQAVTAIQLLKDAGIGVDPGQEGFSAYRRGEYDEARRVLEPALSEPGISAETRAFRSFYLAAANEDSGRAADAVRFYDAAVATGAASPYVHRAKYWSARVVEGTGDARSASARYLDLATNGPIGEFSAEAAFRAGYTLLQAGDPGGAVAAWARLDVQTDARLLYWKGRANEALGDAGAAKAAYASAYAADRMGFYGGEAARRGGHQPLLVVAYQKRDLGKGIDWDAVAGWLRPLAPGGWPGSSPTAAADLLAVGLRDEAATVLSDEAAGAGPWRLLELMREAQGLGLTDVAARLSIQLQGAVGVSLDEAPGDLLRVLYPVDYVALLDGEARTNDVDPLFLAALVRQESFWDPSAGSSAGALGLTQVILSTGESIATVLGVRGFTADDLLRPSVSLRFGAYYIGGQLRRYGNAYLALAAYNAGPGNASRWAERAGRNSDGPDIVEVVDISETSDYVERVMDHYAHYLAAYVP